VLCCLRRLAGSLLLALLFAVPQTVCHAGGNQQQQQQQPGSSTSADQQLLGRRLLQALVAVWGDKSKNNSGTRMCFYAQVSAAARLCAWHWQQQFPSGVCSVGMTARLLGRTAEQFHEPLPGSCTCAVCCICCTSLLGLLLNSLLLLLLLLCILRSSTPSWAVREAWTCTAWQHAWSRAYTRPLGSH
jgi:hypothetical protein